MKITELATADGWDEYLGASVFGDVLQSWEWGEVKRNEGWEVVRIRVMDGQRTVGQAQILIRSMPMGMRLYYVPRGPVLDYGSREAGEVLERLFEWVKHHAVRHRGLMVKVGPAVSLTEVPEADQLLQQVGLRRSFRSIQVARTEVVDLGLTESILEGQLSAEVQRALARAAGTGMVVKSAGQMGEARALTAFYDLYVQTANRGHFPPRSKHQFERAWQLMSPKGMSFIQVAWRDDEVMAATFGLQLGSRAYHLWLGKAAGRAGNEAALFLQWETMRRLKKSGVTSYDLWGVMEGELEAEQAQGAGFGGRSMEYVGDYDLPLSPTYPLYDVADKLRVRVLGGQRAVKKKEKRIENRKKKKVKKEENEASLSDK